VAAGTGPDEDGPAAAVKQLDEDGLAAMAKATGEDEAAGAGAVKVVGGDQAPGAVKVAGGDGAPGSMRWLNEDEMRAWQSFLAAGALVDRRVDQQLKDAVGLSHPQYEILVRLAAAPDGELRMTELADTVLTSKSGLTYQVTQLEKAGLVARRSCPSDVRGVLAVLTEAGRRRLEQAAPGHVALVRELLIDVLTPGQLAVIADALGEVSRRAALHPASGPT
jgi:DNA-binding MarR family transcriptional regulator